MTAIHFLTASLVEPEVCGLLIERTRAYLVRRIEVARDSDSRRRGLLGRTTLDVDTGLVIAPSQGVHTFGMQFPIDVIGVSRDGYVKKICAHVPPRRVVFALSAFAILELAAGVAERAGLKVGDKLGVVAESADGSLTDRPTVTR